MLNVLRRGRAFQTEAAEGWKPDSDVIWIDLVQPTRAEEIAIEAALGVQLPTVEEMEALEPSSRLYEENGVLYMTLSALFGVEDDAPQSDPIGFVLTPRWVPGFSVSADYYNIKVKNAIAFVSAQAIVNACYDQPSFPNVFCGQFERAGSGGGPHGEQEFQIIEGSLISAPLNYAKLTARGIDTEIAYRHNFSGIGRFDTRFTYTHVIDRSNFISATVRMR